MFSYLPARRAIDLGHTVGCSQSENRVAEVSATRNVWPQGQAEDAGLIWRFLTQSSSSCIFGVYEPRLRRH
jgi:hypothetical protein